MLFIDEAKRLSLFAALRHSREALKICRSTGDKATEIEVLATISWFHSLIGAHHKARAICAQALSLIEETSLPSPEAFIWGNLGFLEHKQRNFGKAARCYERAVSIFHRLGFVGPETVTLFALADARHAAGEESLAREAWQRSLAFLDLHDQKIAAEVRGKLTLPTLAGTLDSPAAPETGTSVFVADRMDRLNRDLS